MRGGPPPRPERGVVAYLLNFAGYALVTAALVWLGGFLIGGLFPLPTSASAVTVANLSLRFIGGGLFMTLALFSGGYSLGCLLAAMSRLGGVPI